MCVARLPVLGAPASIIGSELPWLLCSGPLSWIETFVTFCGMVGLQAMVLGRLGCRPHPRASALSCPSPFAGRGSHTSQAGYGAPAFIMLVLLAAPLSLSYLPWHGLRLAPLKRCAGLSVVRP